MAPEEPISAGPVGLKARNSAAPRQSGAEIEEGEAPPAVGAGTQPDHDQRRQRQQGGGVQQQVHGAGVGEHVRDGGVPAAVGEESVARKHPDLRPGDVRLHRQHQAEDGQQAEAGQAGRGEQQLPGARIVKRRPGHALPAPVVAAAEQRRTDGGRWGHADECGGGSGGCGGGLLSPLPKAGSSPSR
jgi:hypothetical protein